MTPAPETEATAAAKGAGWLAWIGLVSVVNVGFALAGSTYRMVLSLCFTDVLMALPVNKYAMAFAAVTVALAFATLGTVASRSPRPRRLFAVGAVLYGLDGLLLVAFGGWLGVVIHGLVVWQLLRARARLGQPSAAPEVEAPAVEGPTSPEWQTVAALRAAQGLDAAVALAISLVRGGVVLPEQRVLALAREGMMSADARTRTRELIGLWPASSRPWAFLRAASAVAADPALADERHVQFLALGREPALLDLFRRLARSRPTVALAMNEILAALPALAAFAAEVDSQVLRPKKRDSVAFAAVIAVIFVSGYAAIGYDAFRGPQPYSPPGARKSKSNVPPAVELCVRGSGSTVCRAALDTQAALDAHQCTEARKRLVDTMTYLESGTDREHDALDRLSEAWNHCEGP